ncbi:MAG: flagellar biosynthesis protein FlgC [Pseudomonadota bacterium]
MQLDNVSDVIRAGLTYERMRAEVASYNLAIANVAIQPGALSPLQTVTPPSAFAQQLGLTESLVKPPVKSEQSHETRVAHDPAHPLADTNGMVHYPKLDAAKEMTTLVSAARAYEADIRAYNSLRAMTLKAFEIGK